MRTHLTPLCFAFLLACQGNGVLEVLDPNAKDSGQPTTSTTTTTTGPTGGGACGEITRVAMSVTGRVVAGDGSPASFADVWVEDQGWAPTDTVIGSSVADVEGNYKIDIDELVSAEDCWGSVLDYRVIGEQGPISGERKINNPLFNAIQDGTFAADLAPLELL